MDIFPEPTPYDELERAENPLALDRIIDNLPDL